MFDRRVVEAQAQIDNEVDYNPILEPVEESLLNVLSYSLVDSFINANLVINVLTGIEFDTYHYIEDRASDDPESKCAEAFCSLSLFGDLSQDEAELAAQEIIEHIMTQDDYVEQIVAHELGEEV